ncbi:MAG: GNAT family N-acetyltransferase [Clostridia bacterium]|nr:GNAT family N-acetyltransferase [Clostridium sp.]MBS6252166.1 GNAT family N-acetyltransferase [Clostridium sp.]
MKEEIIFREFKKEDSKIIEEIIIEAWHYNDLCSSKIARKMAKVFLSSCLTNQTYTQVALLNNQPIGIIMAKNSKIHRCPFKYRIKQIRDIISLYLSTEGRQTSKIFSSVNSIDEELLNECTKKYEGEVAFFAISSKARGKGIGKRMFSNMLEYMKSQNIKDFYLYTDTSCNYGFYEHQGMIKRKEKSKTFFIQGKEAKMTFFIYDYCIN